MGRSFIDPQEAEEERLASGAANTLRGRAGCFHPPPLPHYAAVAPRSAVVELELMRRVSCRSCNRDSFDTTTRMKHSRSVKGSPSHGSYPSGRGALDRRAAGDAIPSVAIRINKSRDPRTHQMRLSRQLVSVRYILVPRLPHYSTAATADIARHQVANVTSHSLVLSSKDCYALNVSTIIGGFPRV